MKRFIRRAALITTAVCMAFTVYVPGVFASEGDEQGDIYQDEMYSVGSEMSLDVEELAEETEALNSEFVEEGLSQVGDGVTVTAGSKECVVTINIEEGINYAVRKKYDGSGSAVLPKAENTYVLKQGLYCLMIDQDGYYKTDRPFYVSASNVKSKKKTVTAEPQLMKGNGYEPTGRFFRWNSAVENNFYGTDTLNGFFEFDTPSFNEDKAAHEFATNEERIAYLQNAVNSSDKLHMYFMGERTPIIFFSSDDYSEADACETEAEKIAKASEIMANSTKLKICYQAQVHGNEPAAGEAALYYVSELAGVYGDSLAESVDMYIIPTMNPDGIEAFTRQNGDGIDMNRDGVKLETAEMQYVHKVFTDIMPDMSIDTHESRHEEEVSSSGVIKHLDDVKIRSVENRNTAEGVRNWGVKLTDKAIKAGQNAGLRPYYYLSTTNSTTSRGFYGMYNTVSFIIESVGLYEGKDHFDRRVFSQYVSLHALIDNAAKNSVDIKSKVSSARKSVASKGKKYSKTNTLALKHAKGRNLVMVRPSVTIEGKIKNAKQKGYSPQWKNVKKKRALPTAYVISKDAQNVDEVINALSINGAEYFEIAKGTSMKVQQYSGTKSSAKIGSNKTKVFEYGAYVIPMDQVAAKAIAISLEPDVYDNNKDSYDATLAKKMKISQLYRYIGNDVYSYNVE